MRLGPRDGSITVRTRREGVAAVVGHDLLLELTRWEATVAGDAIALTADPGSLVVRAGTGGAKPLTDRDREEILDNLERKVLGDAPIVFRSTRVELPAVAGELTLAGRTRPIEARLVRTGETLGATVVLRQSDWGIKPFRGLMGALKVRDEIEVSIEVRAGDGERESGP